MSEIVVIGAGVVGLACAEQLARQGHAVVVVERHETFGRETSSRNSEVIHAGLYYPPGSLKARLCVEGRELLYEWCAAHGVPHANVGKLIVATTTEEEPALDGLQRQADANGVVVESISADGVRRLEPRVIATAALWSPRSGIVDSHAFMRSLLQSARDHGCQFAWRHRVLAAEHLATGWRLRVDGPDGTADIVGDSVVNAAGLDADEVAGLAGIDVDAAGYRQRWVKGSYFRLRPRNLVRHLVYPIPPPGLPGLGIHVTVDLAGGARLGPDVQPLARRDQQYDVAETEAPRFLAAVSRYLLGVTVEDLLPDQSGIRPKLGAPGDGVRDFIVTEESGRGAPRWVNLLGIESPGLTASLALAPEVETLLSA